MEKPTQIFIGSDHAGYELKTQIAERLRADFPKCQIEDCGTMSAASTDYPTYGQKVAESVARLGGFGVLVCGSGIGISIAANKVKGARAAVVWDVTSSRLSRQHNDANIVCLGARLVGKEVAFDAVRAFLTTPFEGGRHSTRIDLIKKMEQP